MDRGRWVDRLAPVSVGIIALAALFCFYSRWEYLTDTGSCLEHRFFGKAIVTFCSTWGVWGS